jgi:checkpoint serine/threonine-protein kinase
MTLHTKEAMDEVYDLFNQTLSKVTDEIPEDTQSQMDSDDDEDYTSAGESTTTGRLSVATSEAGDETQADFTTESRTNVSVGDNTNGSGWSEFTEIKELPERQDSEDNIDREAVTQDEVLTPTSPLVLDEEQQEDSVEAEALETAITEPAMARRAFSYRSRQLPFMTPIVEKTESSLGAMTALAEKDYFNAKTPSRQNNVKTPLLPQAREGEMWSSPFQPNTEEDKENIKVPQPEFHKLTISANVASAVEQETHPLTLRDIAKEKQKAPIIKDLQCSPIDESIREVILSQIQPPLASYTGFFDRRGQISAKGVNIRRYTKTVKGKGDKTLSLSTPPKLILEGSTRQYSVRRELGKGAFAPVYLVDSQWVDQEEKNVEKPVRMGQGEFGIQRGEQEAVKMEEPPSAWEFYIMRQAKRRLGVSRPSESIVEAYEMHLFEDECFLIEEFRNQGTLLDLVNVCRAEGGVMDEQLAMFFTIELFRTVEALHAKGLIHGDLKADNILVRLNATSSDAWAPQYHRSGMNGWSEKGVTIIDFGRGIDMKVFKPDVQFIADWKTSEADCAEMREMRPWTYQVDYHGLAGIVHSMLFGKYLETVAERGATLGAGATKMYKIRESLKRYWQTDLWSDVFGLLLNPLMHLEPEESQKLPVLVGMKALREKLETYLEANGEKGVGLKSGLRRMENMIKERGK